jgi:hypothetical protein
MHEPSGILLNARSMHLRSIRAVFLCFDSRRNSGVPAAPLAIVSAEASPLAVLPAGALQPGLLGYVIVEH